MTVSPPNLISKLLSHPHIVCHGVQIDSLRQGAQGWQLRSHQNDEPVIVAECDTVILAAAAHTPALLAKSGLDQHTLRSAPAVDPAAIMSMDVLAGQVMHVPRPCCRRCRPASLVQKAIFCLRYRGNACWAVPMNGNRPGRDAPATVSSRL